MRLFLKFNYKNYIIEFIKRPGESCGSSPRHDITRDIFLKACSVFKPLEPQWKQHVFYNIFPNEFSTAWEAFCKIGK
jgi:hypothetical protein